MKRVPDGVRAGWATISRDPSAFQLWLATNEVTLRGADGISRRFSNHRKYESLKVSSNKGTAAIFASYVAWVAPPRTHADSPPPLLVTMPKKMVASTGNAKTLGSSQFLDPSIHRRSQAAWASL
jgi:Alpha-glutamyl/putrescinyl thymine pyrophosphorylase clade 3